MRLLFPAAALLAAAGLAAAADEPAKDRVITVTGTATVYAKPDTARIHYGVRVSEPSADAVKDVIGKTTKTIDEAAKKLKLAGLTVSTAPLGIKQVSGNAGGPGVAVPVAPGGAPPGGGGMGLGPYLGYSSHTATITNSDPDKLRADVDAFVKAITDAGANTDGGEQREQNINIFPNQTSNDGPRVFLSRSDESAARDEALQKAVERAVRNAKAIAKGLGAGEVKVLSVTDAEPDKAPGASQMESLLSIYGGGEGPTTAAHRPPAGEVEVKVKVVVRCSY